jgi:hypothetical protein
MTAVIATLLPLMLSSGYQPSPPGDPSGPFTAQLGYEFTISAEAADEYSPAIAYNSNRDEYLVVWHDAYDVIYGQRVLPSGQLLNRFVVSDSPNGKRQASVAYDSTRDRYLVTWVYDYFGDGSDFDVYGRFIPWDGPNASVHDFQICTWTSNQWRPALAFARTQDEFLVVWMSETTGVPGYISGRRIWADGTGFPGAAFTISSSPTVQRDYPDVAYNLARNQYLVTWDLDGVDIWGVRLSATGLPQGGGEFVIAGWPSSEAHASVAACHKADQYLVAWQSDQDTGGVDWAIYARYLGGDGVPGSVYLVDDTTAPEREADVSCDTAGRQYLLAWQTMYNTGYYGVWGRIAYPDETMEAAFGIVQPSPSHNRTEPAVGGGRGTFLTAWEHETGFIVNRDVHGRTVFPDLIFQDGFQ